jgi:hypothetical protein
VLENSNYKLYYDRSIITDPTAHNNSPDKVIHNKTVKEASLIDVTYPNSHNFHSTITEKLQKHTDLKVELIRTWQLKMAYTVLLVISKTCIILHKLRASLNMFNIRPALVFLCRKREYLIHVVFGRTVNNKCLFSETRALLRTS